MREPWKERGVKMVKRYGVGCRGGGRGGEEVKEARISRYKKGEVG